MQQPDTRTLALITWLAEQGLRCQDRQVFLNGFCEQLINVGVPLLRFHLAQRAFHPKFGGIGFNWTRNEGISQEHYEHREAPRDIWLQSPLFHLLSRDLEEFRSDLNAEDRQRFPILEELRRRGATDYLAQGLRFSDEDGPVDPYHPSEGVLFSWSSDHPEGFSDADLELLRSVTPHMGLALKSMSNRQMASDLLQVYLGRDAGRRVLSGEIQRGSSDRINAVICLFDLKGFTSLAEQLPGPEVIDMLNDYFGIAVAVIQAHGGNILKFMGDGMLTMFNLGSIAQDAKAALDAAAELRTKIGARNDARTKAGLPAPDFTLALHAGDILYGNIGAQNRLDFTVIGPTVNQTARIAGLHHSVGQSVILSEEVQRAGADAGHDLVSLGRYMLRSVPEPIELFTIYEGSETLR
ncbi:adenylate/guanylate cyclase domain-containing protein [Phaeobacter sp. QD34_3]|uniref:adenylate/guanylate cyclase domain-containing protein n=1 Tax=unclassified Phaeobacter TaxID=2621772 RepID=UPI00237FCE5A|nr:MULTISPECIES: adenylate/guanylate cyclase domain-containing protein [unclassified Phaeobacter]MDE4132979.1 adenylate/guanylate cyclase domain-containing protein [Phaeobacter sp. QD34_3]MDE4136619.1 adenylate/guanylate cyclase domain-containing protein [Phaeobacter sp. QD34_24]